MKKVTFGAVAAFAASFGFSALAADIALVVQNVRYANLPSISDVGPSFGSYAQAYRNAGFQVIEVNNGDREKFRRGLIEFEGQARNADRVVIDFTGHTGTHGTVMLTKATDARDQSVVERYTQSPSVQLFFELVRHRPGRAAVVLSSTEANVNHLVSTRTNIPQGVAVIAGAPRDVRFAVMNRFLNGTSVKALSTPRVGVSGYVTDQPFAAAAATIATPQAPAAPAPVPGNSGVFAEMADWRAASSANTEASLSGYLNKYPNGLFVREARARLEELVPPAQRAENAMNLTRSQRRVVQQQLTLLGHNTRGIDGIWGNGTRRAIQRWQAAEGFDVTGFVDGAQLRALSRQAERREAEIAAEEAEAKRAAEQADLSFWQQTGSGTTEAGLRAYLERFPAGLFAPQAKRAIAQIEANRPQEDPALLAQERALGLTAQMRQLAEQRLQQQGLNPGPVDGNFDANTRNALRQFQQRSGIKATGYMDRQTVAVLIVSSFR